MKILIISPAKPYRGGIANFTEQLYNELSSGSDIEIINFKRLYPKKLFPGKSQYEETDIELGERILDSTNFFTWLGSLNKIFAKKPDVVVFVYWLSFFAPLFSFLAKRLKKRGIKTILLAHNIISHEPKPWDRKLTKILFKYIDKFILLSKNVQNDLLTVKKNSDFTVLFHPVYSKFGEPTSKEDSLNYLNFENKDYILFFGLIREYKGLDILLKAIPEIISKKNITFLIVGENYEEKNKYTDLIKSLNIENNVIFIDKYIPEYEVKYYFSVSELVVLPYRNATQSGIIQLSYNFLKPVLCSKIEGLKEYIDEGKTGLLFESENSENLALKLIELIDSISKIDYSENIVQYNKRFTWNNFSKLFINFIK